MKKEKQGGIMMKSYYRCICCRQICDEENTVTVVERVAGEYKQLFYCEDCYHEIFSKEKDYCDCQN